MLRFVAGAAIVGASMNRHLTIPLHVLIDHKTKRALARLEERLRVSKAEVVRTAIAELEKNQLPKEKTE